MVGAMRSALIAPYYRLGSALRRRRYTRADPELRNETLGLNSEVN
jgi:hypothetical protein